MTTQTTVISTQKFNASSITKLNGDNYRVWKMRLVSMFTCDKSLTIVDGTEARPTWDADAEAIWDRKSSEAFTAMLMTMSDEQVEAVSGCRNAQEVWKTNLLQCTKVRAEKINRCYGRRFMQLNVRVHQLKHCVKSRTLPHSYEALGS